MPSSDAGIVPICLQAECKQWDVSTTLFSPALWPAYHSIMRADFNLFDQYDFTHEGASSHVLLSPSQAAHAMDSQAYSVYSASLHVES